MSPSSPSTAAVVLDVTTWRAREAAHHARVDAWLTPHLERRRTGQAHPVEDFLFTYYSFRPAALRRWHPGAGVALEQAEDRTGWRGYRVRDGVAEVDPSYPAGQRDLVARTAELLAATAGRPAQFGCFGLHEWAMVYRQEPEQVRHAAWPLRLGPAGTDAVVENHRIACSHFDAFRFFTEPARSLNVLQPGRDDRAAFEQPGCLHAGMDLYKHSARLLPLVPAELVADCFALARDIRTLDMRASPYDLSALGYAPVRIETTDGKQEYATAQRAFSERAAPLRADLLRWCRGLLDASVV